MQRRREAGLGGRTAVAGTQEEEQQEQQQQQEELGWVEARDPRRMMEESFAERKEAAAQRR